MIHSNERIIKHKVGLVNLQEQFLVPDDGAGVGWRRSGPSLSLVGQRQRGLLEAAERRFLAGRAKQSHRAARLRVPAHSVMRLRLQDHAVGALRIVSRASCARAA